MPRSLDDLLSSNDPAWPDLINDIATAHNLVRALPRTEADARATLRFLQVTVRSTLGAIAWETGGLLIDDGWIRVLGSGHADLPGTLHTWNDATSSLHIPGALIVAHDAIGGVFALNGNAFAGALGNVWYFAPDTLQWEPLNRGYTDFVHWLINGDLETYYKNARWPGWRDETRVLAGDRGVSIYPPLWTAGTAIAERSRRIVPINELLLVARDFAAQLDRT